MDLPDGPDHSVDTDWTPSPVPPRRPGIWSGLGMVALYMVLQFVAGILLMMLLAIGYGIVETLRGHPATRTTVMHLAQQPDVKTGLVVVVIALVAALMLWLIHRCWPAQWSAADPPGFGFVIPDDRRFILYAVLIGIVVAVGGGFLTRLLAHGHPVHQNVTVMGLHVTLSVRIALSVLVVCVAPLVEELIFRGVLLSGLMRSMPTGRAVVISAVVFGCMHFPDFGFAWYPIPTLVILGLLLAWIRLKARSLWPSVTMHATNNLIAVIGWFVIAAHPHP